MKSAKQAFCTKLPPKVTRQACKTSASYETSSKSHASSLQKERFVRDFLQKSRVKPAKQALRTRPPQVTRQVSKRSVSYETSSKSHMSKSPKQPRCKYETSSKCQAGSPVGAHTSSSPANAVSRFQPFQTTAAHTPIPMSQRHAPPLQLATCACHENLRVHTSDTHKVLRLPRKSHFTPQNPRKVLRLPRKVTISYHESFNKICTTPPVWNDFDPF